MKYTEEDEYAGGVDELLRGKKETEEEWKVQEKARKKLQRKVEPEPEEEDYVAEAERKSTVF